MWGAPDALRCLGAHPFLLLSHLLGSHNKYRSKSSRTQAHKRVGIVKQCSKLPVGQNKHGQNIATPKVYKTNFWGNIIIFMKILGENCPQHENFRNFPVEELHFLYFVYLYLYIHFHIQIPSMEQSHP